MDREALAEAVAPLRNPLYRALWLASLASNIGTWMHWVAAAWLMTTLAATPLMIALVQTAALLPIFLFGLVGGVLADTKDRRNLLLFGQAWMLIAACLMGLVTLAGWVTPMWLLALTFALGFGQALTGPAWQTATPQIASGEQMPAVIALNGVQFNIARAIGPAIGGLLMAATSAGVVFLVNAMSFVGVILVFTRWKPDRAKPVCAEANAMEALRDGLRFVRRSRVYHALLVRSAFFAGSFSALWALLPVVAKDTLHASALEYGLLLGCAGLGAVIGAGIQASLRAQFSVDVQAAWGIVIGACSLAGIGLETSYLPAALSAVGCGISWMITVSVFNVRSQTAAPESLRARSLSVYMLVFQGSLAFGASVWGAVAGKWGVEVAMLASSVCIAVGLLLGWKLPLADHGEEVPRNAYVN